MSKISVFCLTGVLFTIVSTSSLAGCAAHQNATPISDAQRAAVETEVRALLTRWADAYRANDPEAIRSVFVEDDRFYWVEDGAVAYPSVQSIIDALAGLPPDATIEIERKDPDIALIDADHASVVTEFESAFEFPGVPRIELRGVTTLLAERTNDGWRVVNGHNSTLRERGGR